MKILKKYHHEIILIAIIVIGMLILFACCERPEYPNLLIGNHFATGRLYVIDLPTEETIISETFQLWDEKYLHLDIGTYKVKLIIDSGNDPARQNRQMTVLISSVYTQSKILFK